MRKCLLFLAAVFSFASLYAGQINEADMQKILDKMSVVLQVKERPPLPKIPSTTIDAILVLQANPGKHTVSFGLPLGPDWLEDETLIAVFNSNAVELPVATKPLVYWWLDFKKGSLRSVLVQFEMVFADNTPVKIKITLDRKRSNLEGKLKPVRDTLFSRQFKVPAKNKAEASDFDYMCPQVLVTIPPEWLCASLVGWHHIPESANTTAPWYDKHLSASFKESIPYLASNKEKFEAHLFDRPSTYAKIYLRRGGEESLLATIQTSEFYISHLDSTGFFNYKPGDLKYV